MQLRGSRGAATVESEFRVLGATDIKKLSKGPSITLVAVDLDFVQII